MIKKTLLFLLLLVIVFLAIYHQDVWYGIQQAKGQYKVLSQATDVNKILEDKTVADSIKKRLKFIQQIKSYAADSLHLNATDNYETFYDQKGKAILWMLTASPEFEIKAQQWSFPIAGTFDYKGFFDFEKAQKEANDLIKQGFDTEIDEVAAWSTLGWFSDPILSSMLNRSDGRLAELIIHESTHATVFIKDNVRYNENLANYIGKKGAQQFLSHYFPSDSSAVQRYVDQLKKKELFRNYMLESSRQLQVLYESFDENTSIDQKRVAKSKEIEKIKWGLLEIGYFEDSLTAKQRLKNFNINNAYFSGLSTYNSEYKKFDSIVRYQHNGRLKHFIDSIIETHGTRYF